MTRTVAVVAIVAGVAALYLGRTLLIPVAVAVLLTLLLSPVAARLERWGLGRIPATILVVAALLVVTAGLTYVVGDQVSSLAERLPDYKEKIRAKIAMLRDPIGGTVSRVYETIEDLSSEISPPSKSDAPVKVEVVDGGPPGNGMLRGVADVFASTLGALAVIAVLVLFLLIYRSDLRDRVILLFGVHRVNLTTQTMDEAGRSVSRYLFMLALVNTLHGAAMTVGLLLLGVPQAVLWGCFAALLRFIPYVGPFIAAVLPVTVCLGVYDSLTPALLVVAFVIALELVSNNLLEPWLYAGRTGLSPLAVVVAAVFWAWLWGGMGLLLAVPLTVSLVVLGRHVPPLRFLNTLLGSDVRLEPHVCVYHRLLSHNVGDVTRIFEDCGCERPTDAAFDEVLVPALALAEQDRQAGTLDDERLANLRGAVRDLLEDCPVEGAPDPRRANVHVVCVAAGGGTDDLAAAMLSRLLTADGFTAHAMDAGSAAGEKAERVATDQADIVAIAAVPPANLVRVRGLCKWLRRRFPELTIVVALLNGAGPGDVKSRIELDDRIHVVTTLAEARRRVGEAAVPLMAANQV